MGELKKWREEKWVRIGLDGSIKGACGTSKNKKNPDRCLPLAKAKSMTKAERAKTARKKKRGGGKGKQFVANTKKAKVTKPYV
tara:strand:- start:1397 stop:1645 length:249 start_codon:yes stop_codon:yes gene_type:complete